MTDNRDRGAERRACIVPTRHEKIMVLQLNHCGNYADLSTRLDELIQIADTYDIPAIKLKLKEIVPEHTPWG